MSVRQEIYKPDKIGKYETEHAVDAPRVDPLLCVWIFVFGSIAGFILETIWCLVYHGRFMWRSALVFGTFNVVYGIGALALYFGLLRVRPEQKLKIFMVGAVGGTVVEFVCSWLQEMVFGTVSWDYSSVPFNVGGRVCLTFCVAWGLLALCWVHVLLPVLQMLVSKIPAHVYRQLTMVVVVFLLINISVSAAAISRWVERVNGEAVGNLLGMVLDRWFPDGKMAFLYSEMIFF